MNHYHRNYCGPLLVSLVLVVLTACSGDDGSARPAGPPGGSTSTAIGDAQSVTATIGNVTIASPPVMTFTLADDKGNAVTGLPATAINISIAKLVPGSDGNARYWQSYLNAIEAANGVGPGTVDQVQAITESGNTVDMTVMTHKIHRGSSLPSVQTGGEYAIWGFFDSKHDYSNVVHPQDIRNCRNFHDQNDAETPDAANWFLAPTVEACGSCHDEVNFESGENHGNGITASNAECDICHAPGDALGVEETHTLLAQVAADAFEFKVLEVLDSAPGQFPTVTVSVTDPTNNDAPYDLLTDPAFANGGRLRYRCVGRTPYRRCGWGR